MNHLFSLPLAFGFGPMELTLIAGIGLLLFGKRLPEVGKSVARGIVEFKKGLKDLEDDVDDAASAPAKPRRSFPVNERDAEPAQPASEKLEDSETVSR